MSQVEEMEAPEQAFAEDEVPADEPEAGSGLRYVLGQIGLGFVTLIGALGSVLGGWGLLLAAGIAAGGGATAWAMSRRHKRQAATRGALGGHRSGSGGFGGGRSRGRSGLGLGGGRSGGRGLGGPGRRGGKLGAREGGLGRGRGRGGTGSKLTAGRKGSLGAKAGRGGPGSTTGGKSGSGRSWKKPSTWLGKGKSGNGRKGGSSAKGGPGSTTGGKSGSGRSWKKPSTWLGKGKTKGRAGRKGGFQPPTGADVRWQQIKDSLKVDPEVPNPRKAKGTVDPQNGSSGPTSGEPERDGASSSPSNEKNTSPSATAAGTNTGGKNMGKFADLGEDIKSAASTAPMEAAKGLEGVFKELEALEEGMAQAYRTLSQRVSDEFPAHPDIPELLANQARVHSGFVADAREVQSAFKRRHSGEFQRIEEPRTNEQAWDVTKNNE